MRVEAGIGVGRRAFASAVLLVALLAPAAVHAAPGDLDPSFGRFGVVELRGGLGLDPLATPDGGVILRTRPGAGAGGATLTKLDRHGRPDRSFGDRGTVALDPTVTITAYAVAGDGAIVLAGSKPRASSPGQSTMYVTRLRPDGSPDPAFGSGGSVTPLGDDVSAAYTVATSAGGAITVGGAAGSVGTVARLNPDGSLATGWASGGTFAMPGNAAALLVDESGATYVATAVDGKIPYASTAVIQRLDTSGAVDPSWSSGGSFTIPSGYVRDLALERRHLALLFQGVIPPYACLHGCSVPAAVRFLRLDGTPDLAADARAAEGIDAFLSPRSNRSFQPAALAADGGDQLLVAGSWAFESYASTAYFDAAVVRLDPDGAPDPKFGAGGLATFPNETVRSGTLYGVATDSRGRIVAGGMTSPIGGRSSLIRLLPGGRRADADADGVADRRDRCPRVPSNRRSGCVIFETSLEARYGRFGFAGKLHGRDGCVTPSGRKGKPRGSLIRVLLKQRGRDPVVARGRANEDGTWLAQRRVRRGRYYATFRGRPDADLGECAAARSKLIKVSGRR